MPRNKRRNPDATITRQPGMQQDGTPFLGTPGAPGPPGPTGPPGPSGAGTGDVIGPAGAVDNDVAVFDGTTGTLLKDSGVLVTALVQQTRQVLAGTGLTGGGTLAADRTFAVSYGTTAGTAAQGNDARLSDARTPTAHAPTHQNGGSDPLSVLALAGFPGGTSAFLRADATFATPAGGGGSGDVVGPGVAVSNDVVVFDGTTGKLVKDSGILYTDLVLTSDVRLTDARTPTAHHTTHESGGSDVVTLAQSQVTNLVTDLAGKVPATRLVSAGTGLTGGGDLSADRTFTVSYGTTAGTAAQGNDARLSDARTPTAHHTTHETGGSDVITSLPASVLTSGTVATARLPAYYDYLEGTPANPAADTVRLYAVDFNGFSFLEERDSAGRTIRPNRDTVAVGKVDEAGGIVRGAVVRVSGASGSNRLLRNALATDRANTPGVGLAMEAGALNAFVRVLTSGLLTGLDTSAFTEGARVFLSATTAGALTATSPVAPNLIQRMGYVLRSHATQGEIAVIPATALSESGWEATHASMHAAGGRDPLSVTTLAGYPGGTATVLRADGTFGAVALGTAVTGTLPIASGGTGATTLTNGRVPFVSGGVFTDDADLTFATDTLTATKLVASTSLSTPSILTASGALTITPAAGSNLNVALSTTGDLAVATDILYVDTSTRNIGMGTTTPTNVAFSASSRTLHLKDATNGAVFRVEGTSNMEFGSGAVSWVWVTTNNALGFATNNNERMRITAGGDVGIGTSAIASVVLSGAKTLHLKDATNNAVLRVEGVAGSNLEIAAGTSACYVWVSTANMPLVFGTGGTERVRVDAAGNVVIGGATPAPSTQRAIVMLNGNPPSTPFPANTGHLYVDAGKLMYRGPTTLTQLAPA